MIDYRLLLEQPEATFASLKQRGLADDLLTSLVHSVNQRLSAIQVTDQLRQSLNSATAAIQQHLQAGNTQIVESERQRLKELKNQIKTHEEALAQAEQALNTALLHVPNIADKSVPVGLNEHDNQEVRQHGKPIHDTFTPKPHWDLVESLGLVDFARASKISGPRFAVYRGLGARLERALAAYMLDLAREHGYTEIAPPLLVRPEAMAAAGQYPKFIGEAFETNQGEHVLIPTSEVPLVNLHQNEILEQDELPLRYTALTPCFRREAGSAGKDTRGLIRNHQFYKVELVAITTPEQSAQEHERLTHHAEVVLQRLKLPYRVVSLCTGDMGFAAAKTYDLEVWLPGQATYREISSCSNCTDFQARRAQIRYRAVNSTTQKTKNQLVHTLNGSSLAVGRTFVAVVENYQQADGSIRVPEVLVPYLGVETITRY